VLRRWATGWMIRGSRPGMGWEFFSRPALGLTQPPIQWVPEALSLGMKQPGCEADQSPQSSGEVNNAWSYTSIPPVRRHVVLLS
jgi:hypothetical protein